MKVKEFLEKLEPIKDSDLKLKIVTNTSTEYASSCIFMDPASLYTTSNPLKKVVCISNVKYHEEDEVLPAKELYNVLSNFDDDYNAVLDYYIFDLSGTVIISITDFNVSAVEVTKRVKENGGEFCTIYVSPIGMKFFTKSHKKESEE